MLKPGNTKSLEEAVKPGVQLLADVPGIGAAVARKVYYDFRLRMWLSRGDPIRWNLPWGIVGRARLEDDGATLFKCLRVDRECLFAGLFYGVQGMRIGGTRRIRVAPHLAYGESGVAGSIPPNALLTVEIHIVGEGGPS